MNENQLNKIKKGHLSEADFVCQAIAQGWEIATPFHRGAAYDYLLLINSQWKTVQVKTAYAEMKRDGPRLVVSLRRSMGSKKLRNQKPYQQGDFDLLFVTDLSRRWLIPWEMLKETKSCILVDGPKFSSYKI